jgi:hypothetical protein
MLQIHSCNTNSEVIKANENYCLKTNIEAIKQAENKWFAIYGKSIYDKKPFTAKLINDTIWVIQGTLSKWKQGGVPYAEINAKNCEFIKVTHGK